MRTQVSGHTAARTSRPTHLSLAPEPGSIPEPDESPEARAYRAGRCEALASVIDANKRTLANLDRLEAMEPDELDKLAELAASIAHSKRTARPALALVTGEVSA